MAENIALTVTELFELTHYVRALEELREPQRMGIRAHRRADGTVCVLRAWPADPDPSAGAGRENTQIKMKEG